MAPPNTYLKISRNIAPWMVPSTMSCGVRMYRSSERFAIWNVLGPSPVVLVAGVAVMTAMMISPRQLSVGSGLRRGLASSSGGRLPGQGQEHLVELGLAQRDVFDLDAGVLDRPQRVHQHPAAALDGDADLAGALVDPDLAVVELAQHVGDLGHVFRVADVHLDHLAAHPGLELGRRTVRDHPAVVDDHDVA